MKCWLITAVLTALAACSALPADGVSGPQEPAPQPASAVPS